MSKKRYRIVTDKGELCPRCQHPAQEREHAEIGDRELNRPFYYSKWWSCQNRQCATTIFMRDEHKVMNKNAAARQMRDRQEYAQQMDFLTNL